MNHALIGTAFLLSLVVVSTFVIAAEKGDDPAATVIRKERAALDRWAKGDPDGFLEISDPNVVYFDPFQPGRVNGIEELRRMYAEVGGKISIDHYEMVDPEVQVDGNIAVLTFNFVSSGAEGEMRWNTTEVYRRRDGEWRIIHTHWSLTQSKLESIPAVLP